MRLKPFPCISDLFLNWNPRELSLIWETTLSRHWIFPSPSPPQILKKMLLSCQQFLKRVGWTHENYYKRDNIFQSFNQQTGVCFLAKNKPKFNKLHFKQTPRDNRIMQPELFSFVSIKTWNLYSFCNFITPHCMI